MKRCPITYEIISDQENYSRKGLLQLSPQLKELQPLTYSAAEQREVAIQYVGKMSIQGVQHKLSAKLKVKLGKFEVVEHGGNYILKPQSYEYPELPENEALSMSLAAVAGFNVPVHGLIYSKDGSMTYFVKRFDRISHNKKLALEDFTQLLQLSREVKYASSMEKVAEVIQQFCTFPKVEWRKLFKLTLFNFLIGNEDMHLKNFSLITKNGIVELSPAYDLVNSTIALGQAKEEIALSIRGKKNNLRRNDFANYFAAERLSLNEATISSVFKEIEQVMPGWEKLIQNSFLSASMKKKYQALLDERWERLAV